MTVFNYSMRVVDSKHHEHKVVGIARVAYSTKLTLDDGACVTVSDTEVQEKSLVEVYGSKGTDYYITITKEVA
jgi:hypothetical protein